MPQVSGRPSRPAAPFVLAAAAAAAAVLWFAAPRPAPQPPAPTAPAPTPTAAPTPPPAAALAGDPAQEAFLRRLDAFFAAPRARVSDPALKEPAPPVPSGWARRAVLARLAALRDGPLAAARSAEGLRPPMAAFLGSLDLLLRLPPPPEAEAAELGPELAAGLNAWLRAFADRARPFAGAAPSEPLATLVAEVERVFARQEAVLEPGRDPLAPTWQAFRAGLPGLVSARPPVY